ncbi:alpha-N-acetylgalactosaminide alpha-2,6-sialyltransferase 1-like [Mastacembelus armatus]|uniref:alpha-N-acetylgalactosaminide alpha-2,6-sialyltransferase n=1 Tax=Mastacembelus armatus TaxID=205130 RepID=A0A3Q3L311_9TELE|nr:alpha-N-acetylgalactosaminide alpha-2,6-sialyltransferase 1-like [Mastacembelus armatus]
MLVCIYLKSKLHISVMAARTSRILFLVFVIIAVNVVLFIFSWDYLSQSISLTIFPGLTKHNSTYQFFHYNASHRDENGNSRQPLVFNITQEKIANSIKTNPNATSEITNTTHGQTETPIPVLYKTAFSKYPQWDFEDIYNQDAPPRQNICAQSLLNSKNESFTAAFLPNIRLFLHKDNINMSEWNRLSHFNNPFGFMDYKYEDVMASVKLIPKPKEPLLLPKPGSGGCVRCAVVGTGGILNGSKMGKEIDSHDYVFRMNGAVVKGYEEDVGNKTSVYVHTALSITSSLDLFKRHGSTSAPNDEGIKYVLIPEGMKDFNWLEGLLKGERVSAGPYKNQRPWTYYGGQFNESRVYVLHQDFLRYVRNRFLKSKSLDETYWALFRPTNGAFTVFLAIHTCDTVNVYGFMTEEYKKYSNYYFERGPKSGVIFYINHDYILELQTWKKLHDSNIIKLYQRTD